MSLPICRLRLGCAAPRLSQITAGFALLEQKNLLHVCHASITPLRAFYQHDHILEADFGNDTILAYDLSGHNHELPPEQLARLVRCFKRNYNPESHNEPARKKLRPLGLNYPVTCPGNVFDSLAPQHATRLVPEDYLSHNSYPAYKALFITQLLPPRDEPAERANQLRLSVIRACRRNFGAQFTGGLEDSEHARAIAPDLILPAHETRRSVLLRLLKENYVCITDGEQNLAEFTAAGRAILTTPLRFHLPGKFERMRNYATYDTADDCLRRLGELLSNTPRVHRMEAANFAYHNTHVRPDALILQTLQDALPEMFG